MNLIRLTLLFTALTAGGMLSGANDFERGLGAPPSLIERARLLANEKNYQGIDALLAEIDLRYHGEYTMGYYQELFGVYSGIYYSIGGMLSQDYAGVWMKRKIIWKVILAPNTKSKDARRILDMKGFLVGVGLRSPVPLYGFDYDQFLALRRDAYELLKAYGRVLQAQVVPNFEWKPQIGPMSIGYGTFNTPTPEEIEQNKKDREEATRNGYENEEQVLLQEELRRLAYSRRLLLNETFSYPPEDNEVVADLVTLFPSSPAEDERFLGDFNALRKVTLKEMKDHPLVYLNIPTWVMLTAQ